MTIDEAIELGIQIGVAEERARVARERLQQLHDLARGGAFVTGTYDAKKRVESAETVVKDLRSRLP